MSAPFENKLANLIVNLRETASEATRLAAQVEAALLKIYEEEGATPSEPQAPQFKINSDITQLIEGKLSKFDMSAKNIADLRDYAFIQVHANTGSTVTFTYATASTYTRMCFMSNMLPEVNQVLQEGGIYVVHNQKRKGKNFWDMAVACEGEPHQIQARAKKLAKLFAELKNEGKL
jgi:hypothetical protein